MRSLPRRLGAIVAAALALGLTPGASSAADAVSHAVCLDSSSPSYTVDRRIVAALAKYGDPLVPFVFDGTSGISDRFFTYLAHVKCGIIMGFPVDLTDPDPPDGLAFTKPYLTTSYVLASRTPLTLARLKPGSTIAVGMATAPHFYLAGAFGSVPNYVADTYQSQEQALDALMAHKADAAMVWVPSLVRYRAAHPAAQRLDVAPLAIAHARWHLAALYVETDTAQERRFDAALARLAHSGQLEAIIQPYRGE